MKNRQFDDHVKRQLAGLTPQVPPHVWENIAAAKYRRKPVAFWNSLTAGRIAAVLLGLLLCGSAAYFLMHNSPAVPSQSQIQAARADKQGLNTVALPAQERSAKMNVEHATPGVNDNPVPASLSTNNTAAHSAKARANSFIHSGSAAAFASHRSAAPQQSSFATMAPLLNEAPAASAFNNNAPGFAREDGATANIDLPATRSDLLRAALLRTEIAVSEKLRNPMLQRGLSIPCPKAERDAAGNKRYVEIYGGPDYSFISITDTAASHYAANRRASLKTTVGYSAGIRYTQVFNNGMSFRTGINYSRINETFTSVQGHITHNVYITDNAGDTTGTYSVTGTEYQKNPNKFTTIDIPLMGGYEAGNGRLHTNLNAGVIVNISSRETGLSTDKNGNVVNIGTGEQKSIYRFRTNTGLGLAGAISVYYKLNERLHILAEPYFRYSLSPVTQSDLSLKQKYHTTGLRFGLRLDL